MIDQGNSEKIVTHNTVFSCGASLIYYISWIRSGNSSISFQVLEVKVNLNVRPACNYKVP